jgi:hypothetical protein
VLRIVLVGVTGVYLLRGALIVPDSIVVRLAGYPPRILLFSGVALLIGIVHAVGLARAWGRLSRAEVPREEPSGSPQTKVNNL